MSGKVSLKDIAQILGLSATTVSFILNGKGPEKRISSAAIERVTKYVNESGYKTNHLAKSLVTGKSMTIGLLVEKISDMFFAELAYCIEKIASEYGYQVICCSTDNNNDRAREIINLLRERHVDAYIIVPTSGIGIEIKSLIKDNIPVVLFDRYYPDVDCDYVGMDNYDSSYNAVKHLIDDCEKSNIGFVTTYSNQTQMLDRLSGYYAAMSDCKLKPFIRMVKFSPQDGFLENEISGFLKSNPNIDSLFFATQYLTMAGIKAVGKLKLRIPEDISLISYDDHPFFSVISPTITGIAQPVEKMSISLLNVLMNKIQNKAGGTELQHLVFPAKMNVRASSGVILPSLNNIGEMIN